MQPIAYRSPFRVLGLAPDDCHADALQQVRKKLLAEFELHHDRATIEWNGETLDKQQAMSLVDELKDDVKFAHHLRIAGDPVLLHFMESGETAFLFIPDAKFYDQFFIDFCAPYIRFRMAEMLATAFEGNDPVLLTMLLQPHPLIGPETTEASVGKLRSLLVRAKEEMKQVRRKGTWEKEEVRVAAWAQQVRGGALERLPFALQKERDSFINAFIALLWMIPGDQIRTGEKIRLLEHLQQITTNERSLHRIAELRNRLSFSGLSTVASSRGTGIMLGVPLVILLAWIVLENSRALYSFLTNSEVDGIRAAGSIFFWLYTAVMVGVTIRHVFQVLRARSWVWIMLLILLNVVAMPLYWALFMRHPKDRVSNRIGLVIALLVVGLAVLANVLAPVK